MHAGKLLILDDDPQVGRMIQFIAESSGFEARALTAVDSFFDVADEWQPTHIAIDLIMPEMDGVQVLVKLAARHCKARIIVTSGVGARVLDAAARSGNAHGLDIAGVLAKPFSPKALRALLQQGAPPDAPPLAPGTASNPSRESPALPNSRRPSPRAISVPCISRRSSVPRTTGGSGGACALDPSALRRITPDRFIRWLNVRGRWTS